MEFNLRQIKQLDCEKIYNLLLPIINNLYLSFNYLNISKKDYKNLVLNEILETKKIYKGNQDYKEFLKRKIKHKLSEKTKEMLYNIDTSFTIINNYITKNFNNISNYEETLYCFEKLNNFLNYYDYIPNPDLLIELISKNNYFNKMITIIYNHNQNKIIKGKLEEETDNNLLLLAIDTYCMLNNIEINKLETIKEKDFNVPTTNSLKLYLKEISEIPLLTIAEERNLAIKIAEGDIEAKDLFIKSNLRLVVSIASKYTERGLPLLDLIQDGNLGLMKATDKYDITKGFKFSTYASHWIKQYITRGIASKGRNIRLSQYMYDKVSLYINTKSKMENKLGRTPTENEIAKEMNLPVEEISKFNKLTSDTLSYNSYIGDDEESELADFIPANTETPEELAINDNMKFQIRNLLETSNLSPKEKDILMLRYGFNDSDPLTLQEIGKKYNISREGVRLIENKALMKIRNSKYIKELANSDKSLKNIEDFKRQDKEKKLKQSERKKNNYMKKSKSIYEYFNDYTKEEIDETISKLNEKDRLLLTSKYGEDLTNPIKTKLTREESNKFYAGLMPKMKKMLIKLSNEKENIEEPLVNNEVEEIENNYTTSKVEENNQNLQKENNKELNKEDCTKLLELLKTPTLTQMLSTLSIKEVVIIALKLGYIDGKYFKTEEIAEFLQIEKSEVIDTTMKILLLYKDNINNFLDNVINMETEENSENKTLSKSNTIIKK